MPNLKQVLVTGGAGYIGSHTVISLVNAGYQPVILDNFSNSTTQVVDNLQEIVQRPITYYHGDCRDTNLVSSIFRDHQLNGVIHFAASKAVGESVEKPLHYYKNNLDSLMGHFECYERIQSLQSSFFFFLYSLWAAGSTPCYRAHGA